jgi:hypothetical protein
VVAKLTDAKGRTETERNDGGNGRFWRLKNVHMELIISKNQDVMKEAAVWGVNIMARPERERECVCVCVCVYYVSNTTHGKRLK